MSYPSDVPQASVLTSSAADEFYTEERCFITELSNSGADEALSVALARVEPGVTTAWHRLKTSTERYVIQSGLGRVEIGEQPPQDVTAGDVVLIPPLWRQRITNTGVGDLVFLAICTPRFRPSDYEHLE
jgi:mannose-6-phosphate isomerase-like protein (cupin superfamily)